MSGMNEEVIEQLQKMIRRYGTSLCEDSRRCEGMLRDLCSQHRREVNVLVLALREHVVTELLKTPPGVPLQIVLTRLSQRLQNDWSIQIEAAQWATRVWAEALGLTSAVSQSLAKLSLPTIEFIHGWSANKVKDLQRNTAEVLGLPIMFQDGLNNGCFGPEMVVIPAGEYLIGSPLGEVGRDSSENQHRVRVDRPFALSKYPIMVAEYDLFTEATDAEEPDDEGWGRQDRPVINVSWLDAVAYTKWLSKQTGQVYRLPSEVEWEHACRAGTTSAFFWGNDIDTDNANYDGNYIYRNEDEGEYREQTVIVNSFSANPWGLYQMSGNVWEWTSSLFKDYGNYNQQQSLFMGDDDEDDEDLYVIRGGSWYDLPNRVRSASRDSTASEEFSNTIGFRIARSL